MSWWEEQRPQISRWVRLGITVPDTCLGQIKKSAPGSSRYVSPVHVTLASTCVMSGVVKQISRAISIHEYHWHSTNSLAPLQEVVKKYSGQLAFSCKKKKETKVGPANRNSASIIPGPECYDWCTDRQRQQAPDNTAFTAAVRAQLEAT